MRLSEYEYFKYSDEIINLKKAAHLPKAKAEELATILRIVEKRNNIFVISDPENPKEAYVCYNKTMTKQVGNMFYYKELELREKLKAYENTSNEVMLAVRQNILKNEGYLQSIKLDDESPDLTNTSFDKMLEYYLSNPSYDDLENNQEND